MSHVDRRSFLATTAAGALSLASRAQAQPGGGAEAQLNHEGPPQYGGRRNRRLFDL